MSCQTSVDCAGNNCLSPGAFGACTSGANAGRACGSDADCEGATCSGPVGGRCSQQIDGALSGIGLPCDPCNSANNDVRVLSNSNVEDEVREGAPALGDRCDPVPLTISRFFFGGVNGVQYFTSTAGIGAGGATSVPATAGYRYCSCVDPGTHSVLSSAMCFATGLCNASRDSISGGSGEWKSISLSQVPGFQSTLTFPTPVVNLQTSDTYTSDIPLSCFDFSHPSGVKDTCRLGATQRTLIWSSALDVAAGRVGADGAGNVSGIFLSHVVQTTSGPAFASPRDVTTGGNLRSNYEYLSTANILFPPPPLGVANCAAFGCAPIWRRDWLIDPEVFNRNPGPLRQTQIIGRILPAANGTFGVVGNPSDPSSDVTASLSSGVQTALRATGVRYLSPVESGARGIQSGFAIQFVAMPDPWRQSDARPLAVVGSGGFLQTAFEAEVGAITPPAGRFIPSDRDGARAILSGTTKSVYLLGGHRLDGEATGEVWQYDIVRDTWLHLFMPKPEQPRIGDVLAAAFDAAAQRFVVVDVPKGLDGRSATRLMVMDLRTQTARTLNVTPSVDTTTISSLGALGDGSFFLVQQHTGSTQWTARRLGIGQTQGVACLGHTAGQGTLLDDPIVTTNGVLLPVLDHGTQRLLPLSPSSLIADDPNCLFAGSLPPVALYGISGVTLGDRTSVVNSSGGFSAIDSAGGSVNFGVSAATADVLSIGRITLSNLATINGEARSTGAITLGSGSQVTSGSDPFSPVVVPPLPALNVTFPSGVSDVDLEPSVVRALAPGGYGNVAVKSRATLKLSAGVYTFTSLDLEPQATLSLDESGGGITIDLQNSIIFRGVVTQSSQASGSLLFAYFGTQDAYLEVGYTGSFFAPKANLILGNNVSVFTGQYAAKTITTRPDTKVVY